MKEFVFHFDFYLYICFYYKQYLMIVLCLKIILFFFKFLTILYDCLYLFKTVFTC